MLKVIGINGSPRTGWNTGSLIKKALEGAADAGAATEMVDLGKIDFKPCMSCLVCKKGPKFAGHCYMKDGLSPVLEKLRNADAIVMGTPIYFSQESALFHAFWERFRFSNHAYTKDLAKAVLFPKKVKSALFFTMNINDKQVLEWGYNDLFERIKSEAVRTLGPECRTYAATNTLQVKDYSQYDIQYFEPEDKYRSRKERFPKDLEEAYKIGKWLGTK